MVENILHSSSWLTTTNKNKVELFEYQNKNSLAPILLIGGVHGDEPEGVRLAEDLLVWLQKNHMLGVTFHSWLLIPCLNPDGYLRNNRLNGNGVDLNRNFPSRDWSAEKKSERYHPGPRPASELEVQSLVQLIQERRPRLIIHFHSWKPCVVYTGSQGKEAAEILGKGTGYSVQEDIGYPTPGSLGQYGWYERQTPVICIEAEAGSNLKGIWPKFGNGLKELLCVNSTPRS